MKKRHGFVFIMTLFMLFAVFSLGSNAAVLSPALDVIAGAHSIDIPVLSGSSVNFSKEYFKNELQSEFIGKIVIEKTVNEDFGGLFLDGKALDVGSEIPASSLEKLEFVPVCTKKSTDGFSLTVSSFGIDYKVNCNIHILERLNFAPVCLKNGEIATFSGVCTYGTLEGFDPEGDELTFEIVSSPKKGSLTLIDAKKGKYVYSPNMNAYGKDSFEYTVKDEYGNRSEPSVVSVSLMELDDELIYSDMELEPWAYSAGVLADAGVFTGERIGGELVFSPNKPFTMEEFLNVAINYSGVNGGKTENGADFLYTDYAEDMGLLTWATAPDTVPTVSEAARIIEKLIGDHFPEDEYVFAPTEPVFGENGAYDRLCQQYPAILTDGLSGNDPLTRSGAASLIVKCISVKK